jgi:hypothetical protein
MYSTPVQYYGMSYFTVRHKIRYETRYVFHTVFQQFCRDSPTMGVLLYIALLLGIMNLQFTSLTVSFLFSRR